MNRTYWKEIQSSILEVTYRCNQLPYKLEEKSKLRNLGTTNTAAVEPAADEVIPVLQSWSIESFTSAGMDLQLNFSNPLLVSAYYDKDLL